MIRLKCLARAVVLFVGLGGPVLAQEVASAAPDVPRLRFAAAEPPRSKDALFGDTAAQDPLSKDALFGGSASPAEKSGAKFERIFRGAGRLHLCGPFALVARRRSPHAGRPG